MITRKKDFRIDWKWVRSQVLKKERIPRDKISAIISSLNKCLLMAESLSCPKVLIVRKDIADFKPNAVIIRPKTAFTGKRLSNYIKGAKSVYLILATIGSRLEEEASSLMNKSEGLEGYLLDRIGSFAVESLVESVEGALRKSRKAKGETLSMRFSPGYCDWPIEEQALLSKVLNFSKAGVHLTKSLMMSPKKSISAMVAVGPRGLFSKAKNPCAVCGKKDCDYRRTNLTNLTWLE